MKGSSHGTIYYPGICLERLMKIAERTTQDIQSLGQYLNSGALKYATGALIALS